MAKKVVIRIDGPGQGTVEIDGQKIDGVRAVDFHAEVDECNIVTLHLIAEETNIEIDDEAVVINRLSAATKAIATMEEEK